jgi:hypothetical protein
MRYYNLPKDFDWKFYISYHKDLSLAGIETEKDAINHYFSHGRSENRIYKGDREHTEEEFVHIYKNFGILDKKEKKRLIFINHYESLTGAPILLKELIRYEVEKKEFDVWVISMKDGDDSSWSEFKNIKHKHIPGNSQRDKSNFIEKLLDPDLIYSNTFGSIIFSKYFKCNKILSSHDNRSILEYIDNFQDCKRFNKIIVACNNTKNILLRFGIHSEIVPYYMEKKEEDYSFDGLEGEDFILGAGFVSTRKGVDRFFKIAERIPDQKFIWIGSFSEAEIENNRITIKGNIYYDFLDENSNIKEFSVYESEIPKNVKFYGLVTNYKDLIKIFYECKCFLMVSRDDTFPLVVIESKLMNKNVVNLKESGDSYKICDPGDLILDKFDLQKIERYLKNLKPNKTIFNKSLSEYLRKNIEINRNKYLEIIYDSR